MHDASNDYFHSSIIHTDIETIRNKENKATHIHIFSLILECDVLFSLHKKILGYEVISMHKILR